MGSGAIKLLEKQLIAALEMNLSLITMFEKIGEILAGEQLSIRGAAELEILNQEIDAEIKRASEITKQMRRL